MRPPVWPTVAFAILPRLFFPCAAPTFWLRFWAPVSHQCFQVLSVFEFVCLLNIPTSQLRIAFVTHWLYFLQTKTKVTAVGFEPTPLRTGALSQRLRPLGQTVLRVCAFKCCVVAIAARKWFLLEKRKGRDTEKDSEREREREREKKRKRERERENERTRE